MLSRLLSATLIAAPALSEPTFPAVPQGKAVLPALTLIDPPPDTEGFVRRIGHIDLMDIADPEGVNRQETRAARDLTGKHAFPFFTIVDVMRVNDTQIMVAHDNNLPFSSGGSWMRRRITR